MSRSRDAQPPRLSEDRGGDQNASDGVDTDPTAGVVSADAELRVSRDPELAAQQLAEMFGGVVIAHRWLRAAARALDGGRRR